MFSDSPQDATDLAEFFMGGTNTYWGRKRIQYGLKSTVKPVIWELGNELDWSHEKKKKLYTTGIADLFKLFSSLSGQKVLKCKVSGVYANVKKNDLSFSAAAITGPDKKLYLIFNNRLPNTKLIKVKIENTDNNTNFSYCTISPESLVFLELKKK